MKIHSKDSDWFYVYALTEQNASGFYRRMPRYHPQIGKLIKFNKINFKNVV